jgi:hypothetical protein
MAEEKQPNIPVTLYGVGIHKAAASGDLATMKKTAAEAEQYLTQHGNISAALEALKIEIAKLEIGK